MSPKIAARQRREAEDAEARAEKERARAEKVYERLLKAFGQEALDEAPNMVWETPEFGPITVRALQAKFEPTASDPATAPPRVLALPPASLSAIEQLRRITDPEEKKEYLADTSALADANRAKADPNSGSALDRLSRATTPGARAQVLADAGALADATRRPDTGRTGRPVTSGDANRIAELDTSLNDLATLAQEIGTGAGVTGTRARIGAALPNPITEWTGVGQVAKEKQAVIDRVKQVIGKALEGGVLRREDEYKYTKILPTIADTADTVRAKLVGLRGALQQRRTDLLSALADAGYDVDKFDAREAAPAPLQDRYQRYRQQRRP
jgi:hypothetical protein